LSNRSSLIPQLLRSGEAAAAADEAGAALGEMFGLDVADVVFTQDEYSLNSVSGRARLNDGTTYFSRPVPVQYLALGRAVAAGSEPVNGNDAVSSFLNQVSSFLDQVAP
jgi:hypothetical protein